MKDIMKNVMKNKNKIKFLTLVIIIVLFIQSFSTYLTNTKKFSIQAFLRNLVWAYAFHQIYYTKNVLWLFVPILVNVLYNVLVTYMLTYNVTNRKIEPYLTTEYLYNDYFEYIIENEKSLNYYTEGSYGKLLNIDTMDLSDKNVDKIMKWGEEQYNNSFNNLSPVGFNNENINTDYIAHQGQKDKYEWIVQNLNINKNSRVLELGFGKLDLMKYVKNTGAKVVGCNLSIEHVKDAINNGFEAYQVDHKHLKNYIDKLGKFDVIITNGTLEYLRNGDKEDIFDDFMKNINILLNEGGKWYTTTIHSNTWCLDLGAEGMPRTFDLNWYNFYNLALGNEGCYPEIPNGLTKFAKKNNLKVVQQENRWLDYYIFSIIWLISQIKSKKPSIFKHLNAYIAAPNYLESYLCYTPFRNMYYYQPWLWQFVKTNGCVPTLHQWIIFEKIKC